MRALRLLCVLAFGCGTGALYPPRPPALPGDAIVDPTPARIVVHATVTTAALRDAIDKNVPARGVGSFQVLGATARYIWDRVSTAISYQQNQIVVQSQVAARVMLPIGGEQRFPLTLRITAEPIVSSEYIARLQSAKVEVTSDDARLRFAQSLAGALDEIRDQVLQQINAFALDLKPLVQEAYLRVAKPIDFTLGEAHACAEMRVLRVEAGPTVLADGVEKDVALVVAPSITMPCAPAQLAGAPPPLPPLANVTTLQSGPFVVELPIAARYEELERAMNMAFTDGKLYFNKEFPQLYLEKPEIYAAKDQLVVKLHIAGPVAKYGIHMNLDGDLFMAGHPTVLDNELQVPDLQPTIETSQFLLKLKAALDADSIRDQARAALRLDIGERMRSVRDKMSSELSFGSGQGCLRADVNKIAVTGVHAHASYLRLHVAITANASVFLPCPANAPPPTPVSARP